MTINHHERAARLRDFMDELRHLEDLDEDYGVDLDSEIPKVPQRFVGSEYSGSESRVVLADTLDEARDFLAGLGGGDYAYAPGEIVLDLDTGWTYRATVHVTLARLTYQATYKLIVAGTLDEAQRTSGPYTSRHVSREEAVESLETLAENMRVLDLTLERVAPDEG